jgi:hypothetical protein
LRISERINIPVQNRLLNVLQLKYSTFCAMIFTACCMLGFIHYQSVINLAQSKIRSIEVLLFQKRLVFRVGKKALANRQVLLQFLVASWLVRIANVLGCVGCIILLY